LKVHNVKKLISVLAFGLMVSMQAGAAPLVKPSLKFPNNFVSIDVKVLVSGVEQHHYQADVWGKFSAANSIPGNGPTNIDKTTPIYTVGSKNDLRLEVVTITEDRVDIGLRYLDREELRQYAEGTAPILSEGIFDYENMISLQKGKELRIPYSLCKDETSKICDRVLSITAN
jgi:hypothetical protein